MATGKYKDLLKHLGFQSFLWTQFLGAFNDNFYKIVVSLFAIEAAKKYGEGGSFYLSLAGALFILPFFLFSGYAGHLADVFNKRSVLIVTKSFEIIAMSLGLFAFLSGRIELMLGVLFLMALQAAFFSPAKYGILPEMLPYKDLSRANGLLEMSTFLAIILGTSLGSVVFGVWKGRVELMGLAVIMIAIAGTVTSFGISRVPPSGAVKPFQINPWAEIAIGLKRLYKEKPLWLTVIGISYFWFLGALLHMNILLLGKEVMRLDDQWIGILVAFLAVGIGVGSLVAGRLSGDNIEPGLIPFGSIGMGVFSVLLSYGAASYTLTAAALVLIGFSAGLFIVPLNAFLQRESGHQEKGRLIAANNFLNTGGVLLASGVLWLFRDFLQMPADRIIKIFGFFTFIATAYIVRELPKFLIRFVLVVLINTVYRVRVVGQENIPERGPALLVCNHMSFVDPLLVGSCVQRFIRFIITRPYYNIRTLQWFFALMKAIPISEGSRKDILKSIERAREELSQGKLVCVFAEGAISRTGNLLPFKRGMERITEGLDVPVIPVHLDRIWGSLFSFSGGRFLWKLPRRIPYPVTVSFGKPMPAISKAWEVRQAIMELGSEAVQYRRTSGDLLHLRFMKNARRRWRSLCIADSSGKELNYGKALVGSLVFARWMRNKHPGEKMIGLLLPASVAGALANIAILMAGKVPVNLNFTAGREAMALAVQQSGIKTILTSRMFLEKAKIAEMEGMVFLEEMMREIPPFQKAVAMLLALFLPASLLQRLISTEKMNPDSLATVIFTSGSSGIPKGVMLSHHNILSNVEGFAQVFQLTGKDRVMGVLPFFHSFGFTGTLWFPLVSAFAAVYHPSPLDAKAVGEMVNRYKATLLISTPTFCATYLKRCTAEEFSSLRYVIVGAEKLRAPLAEGFKEKYGLDLLEGYGCTEMGPVVSVNIPDVQGASQRQTGLKPYTVGHPIPGVVAKVVDPETGKPLPAGTEGMLLVKGPGRMAGYLGQPEKTREVLQDGWYITGDIGCIDHHGFITITDRLSRFSKIAGEMVPHIKVEDAISKLLGDAVCIVTSLPDEEKGERLVVLHTSKEMTAEEIWRQLCQTDIARLWIPRRENIYYIDAIPTLGSGKADLRQARVLARQLSASPTNSPL
ncbi:MAG: MFS transporter [Nitrospirae bacterium]|nr:MFS transporter [Nitrospirota bacterium]